jgi:carbon monoxide dehydrogenase subunit G
MAVRIGPVNAKFKGRLKLSDIVPLQSYKINFDGQGGVAGFGKGSANVALAADGDSGQSTRLNYVADAQVGGKIAQVGSRLVESAAAKIADDFFKAFEARMTASNASPGGVSPTEGVAPTGGVAPASGAAPADGALASAPAVATDAMPPRPVPTVDHVAGREALAPAQAQAASGGGGGGSTVWWIAGIIVIALLVYFFTR